MVEDGAVPANPISLVVGRAGCDKLEIRIGPLHQLGPFQGELAVIVGRAVAHLPGPIHLIAEPPILYFPRLLTPILLAEFRGRRVAGQVAILDPLLRFVPGTRTEVSAQIRFGFAGFAILEKLVSAEAVSSIVPHAISRRAGRSSRGPMPSRQL